MNKYIKTNQKSRFKKKKKGNKNAASLCGLYLTHAAAGSDWAGGALSLAVGVTADNCHLHPHWLICGSNSVYVSKCRMRNIAPFTDTSNYDLFSSSSFVCAICQSVSDGKCVVSLLMGKLDACWVFGHQQRMTELGKHFCRLHSVVGKPLSLCCWLWYGKTSQAWGHTIK